MKDIKLFIMSFWIFFVLLIIVTIDIPVSFEKGSEFVGFETLLTIGNIVAFISFIFLLLGALFYYQFMKALKGDLNVPVEVLSVENINYEYFALLVTIVSLIAFDFTTVRGVILLVVLLVILCAIFMKTELFYSNPSFALLGFHIYKADTKDPNLNNKIFITKNKIKVGDKIRYLKISDKVYFTKNA